MRFLSPWALAWLGLLVPLVALYVLKRRRRTREVGSTLLWEAALRDMRAERPWKRLIPHVSLILQALAVVAGAIALARPVGAGSPPSGARIAVVVDASASMAARDHGDGTRMDRARAAARETARGLPPAGRMMLVEAAAEPTVLSPADDDRAALERAVDRLAVRGGRADLEAAVAVAAERMRDAPAGSRIVVLTDRAQDGRATLGAKVPIEVQSVAGGAGDAEPAANSGIVALDVRARPTEDAPDRAELFVRLARFADRPTDVFVTASVAGGDALASRRVTLPAEGTASVVMTADLPPDESGRAPIVEVAIDSDGGGGDGTGGAGDALPLDDVAHAPSPGARKLSVFLVGEAPAALRHVLATDPEVELFATTLGKLAEREAREPLDGLVVYTGEAPDEPPPGDSVVVAPEGERVFEVELADAVEAPRIVTWDEDDPRMRFVSMTNVHIARARPLEGPAARGLVTSDEGPIVGTVRRPDGETTIVGFDPAASDWPRERSFVVFFRNLLERARRHRAEGGVPPGTLGEPLRVPAPDGATVTVRTPDGETHEATSRGGVAVVDVDAVPGVYRIETAGGRTLHALRSLLDRGESDLRPRLEIATGEGSEAVSETADTAGHREAWPWLAAALVVLLAAETWWATRRSGRAGTGRRGGGAPAVAPRRKVTGGR